MKKPDFYLMSISFAVAFGAISYTNPESFQLFLILLSTNAVFLYFLLKFLIYLSKSKTVYAIFGILAASALASYFYVEFLK